MAPRRIVADSDDESDGFSPVKAVDAVDAPDQVPEVEDLSPPRVTAASILQDHLADLDDHGTSDSTDMSFFARVRADQEERALKQLASMLPDSGPTRDQVSKSSGDVSLPGKHISRPKEAHVSSATDLTSPVQLVGKSGRLAAFSDGATQLTTPRKSRPSGDLYEVPSSTERRRTPQSAKGASGKIQKTTSKRKGDLSKLLSLGAANEPRPQPAGVADGHPEVTRSSEPAAKKRRVSHNAASLADTTSFYVAESNLSPGQKKNYQKLASSPKEVHFEGDPKHEVLDQFATAQKSSCATTVAFSTPSRYASSGPRVLWGGEASNEDLAAESALDPPSSPNPVGLTQSLSKRKRAGQSSSHDNLQRGSKHGVEDGIKPSTNKRRKVPRRDDDDELGQDDPWDFDSADNHRESSKPQSSRRKSTVGTPKDGPNTTQDVEVVNEELKTQALKVAEEPSATQAKKRGRKKKQPVSDALVGDEEDSEGHFGDKSSCPAVPATSTGEKPKKKRGRPRKSDAEQTTEAPAGPCLKEDPDRTVLDEDDYKPKADNCDTKNEAGSATDRESVLQEKDGNSNGALEPTKPTVGIAEKPATIALTVGSETKKVEAKVAMKPSVSLLASQGGKAIYRVGLSKRSRIAPLLKSIKK